MASPTQCTWVWANSGRWWRTGKPGMLQSMESQRIGHNWVTIILPPWVTLYTVLRVTALKQNRTHPEYFYFIFELQVSCMTKTNSVQFSCPAVSDYLRSHGLQHSRLPCPSPTPGACSNSCPLSWWCHITISSSVTSIFSCCQYFPPSESFPVSQVFDSGGWSVGAVASASVLQGNIQSWFPLGLTGLISLLFKELSRIFSSTTIWKH